VVESAHPRVGVSGAGVGEVAIGSGGSRMRSRAATADRARAGGRRTPAGHAAAHAADRAHGGARRSPARSSERARRRQVDFVQDAAADRA
jgi:hypothetical protein